MCAPSQPRALVRHTSGRNLKPRNDGCSRSSRARRHFLSSRLALKAEFQHQASSALTCQRDREGRGTGSVGGRANPGPGPSSPSRSTVGSSVEGGLSHTPLVWKQDSDPGPFEEELRERLMWGWNRSEYRGQGDKHTHRHVQDHFLRRRSQAINSAQRPAREQRPERNSLT